MFARLSRIGEYAYIVQEYLIMKYLVSQDGPGPVFKHLFKAPTGWDGRTDWYRNMHADPHVQVGSFEFDCVAEPVPVEKSMKLLTEHANRNPFAARVWSR